MRAPDYSDTLKSYSLKFFLTNNTDTYITVVRKKRFTVLTACRLITNDYVTVLIDYI